MDAPETDVAFLPGSFAISLPEWVTAAVAHSPRVMRTLEERMRFVIELAAENVEKRSGGPFAAAVFERDSGKIISVGVNRVVPESCSTAHAEIVALSLAQKSRRTFDLGSGGLPALQLVVNWRPCAMCFGAIPWSGIGSLVMAGSGVEMEEITGFDEGPMHPHWADELRSRGIEVIEGVLKDESLHVFRRYAETGAPVYNATRRHDPGERRSD
jgi:tRNA(Arg) A34 adenosine deaminase TadA